MKLYYHKAEYLMDTHLGDEGVMNDQTRYIVRIDGDITIDRLNPKT